MTAIPDCPDCTAIAANPTLRTAAARTATRLPFGDTPEQTLAGTLRSWHRRGHPAELLTAIEGATR